VEAVVGTEAGREEEKLSPAKLDKWGLLPRGPVES